MNIVVKKLMCLVMGLSILVVPVMGNAQVGSYLGNLTANTSETLPEATSLTSATERKTSSGYELMARGGNAKLFLNHETTNFYVEDSNTGKRVYAFPEEIEKDPVASDLYKIEMQAALLFVIWDQQKLNEETRNSNAAAVRQRNFKISRQENGFYIEYHLKTSSVRVTLSVVLNDGKLVCSIPPDKIYEDEPERYRLLSVSVLPHMLSQPTGSEGFIILPDGSGETMDYSNTRSWADSYEKKIYGRDKTLSSLVGETAGYDITCPYIAMIAGDVGVLAVPVKGDAIGYVIANPANKLFARANAYFKFEYHPSDMAIIGNANGTTQGKRIFHLDNPPEEVSVTFDFLFSDATPYRLAKLYGEYLTSGKQSGDGAANYDAVFDVYGFVNEKKSFLGIPYTTTTPLSEGSDILKFSENKTVQNTAINLKSITKEHKKQHINTDVTPISKVLTRSQLRKLTSGSMDVLVNVDPVTFKKGSFSANKFFDSSKTIYGASANLYSFLESTKLRKKNAQRSFLLQPQKLSSIMGKLVDSAQKNNVQGLSTDTLAATAYNDYRNGGTLTTAQSYFKEACAQAAEGTQLVLSNPAGYAYAYCSAILNLPVGGSKNDACNGAYPFLQMAIGGDMTYTVEPINLHRSPETLFLNALLTGASLHYSLVLSNPSALIDSDHNYLYSSDYAIVKSMVDEQYIAWKAVREKTGGSVLVDYQNHGNDIYSSLFENGTKVTVDFRSKTYKVTQD